MLFLFLCAYPKLGSLLDTFGILINQILEEFFSRLVRHGNVKGKTPGLVLLFQTIGVHFQDYFHGFNGNVRVGALFYEKEKNGNCQWVDE